MTKKTEYKRVSKRAKLLLKQEEGFDVEFKLGQLDVKDIVAFANSVNGGAILLGVEEQTKRNGRQMAIIRGCDVGDREKMAIISRAESCVPPVDIELFIENSSQNPFYRIEIPSGDLKPYCTSGGTYKIRGDGLTQALLPGRLLYMFVEIESREFINRFRDATKGLEEELNNTKSRIIEEMKTLLGTIDVMEQRIESSLGEIFGSAVNAQELSDEAVALSDIAAGGIEDVNAKLDQFDNNCYFYFNDIEMKLDELLKHYGIEDPIRRIARERVEEIVEIFYIKENKDENEIIKMVSDLEGFRVPISEVNSWAIKKLSALKEQEK